MNERFTLETTPKAEGYWNIGLIEFDLGRAVAEFIDNAIDGRVPGQKLKVQVYVDANKVQVDDNGPGLDKAQLSKALTPGAMKQEPGKIGRYGFGLKTASAYLGKRLEMWTVCQGATEALRVTLDRDNDYDANSQPEGDWQPVAVTQPVPVDLPVGTRVVVSKLKHSYTEADFEAARIHLGKVYHWFIQHDNVEIVFNNQTVKPFKFVVLDDPKFPIDFTVIDENGTPRRVHGWLGISLKKEDLSLPHTDAGMYLSSNNRVVAYPEWVGIHRHPEVARLTGEIHLDEFTLNINKTGFFKESPEWIAFEKGLKRKIEEDRIRVKVTEKSSELAEEDRAAKKAKPTRVSSKTTRSSHPASPATSPSKLAHTNAPPTIQIVQPQPSQTGSVQPPASPSLQVTTPLSIHTPSKFDRNRVFVIHGRNLAIRDAMFNFLRAIGLKPMEWSQVVQLTGEASPYVGSILDTAFSHAGAVVVLMTPDDIAYLRPELQGPNEPDYETKPTGQSRQNVIFEAGMAFGKNAKKTVLVEVGSLRPFSDTYGRHSIRLDNTPEKRHALAQRLAGCDCQVDLSGTDWLSSSISFGL